MAGKSRSLGSLLVNVGADTRALESGLQSATKDVSNFGNKTASTARKTEGQFQKMSRGGAAVADGLASAARFVPGIGGLLGAGAVGGFAMGAINKSFSEMARHSPEVQLIQARREEFSMHRGMIRGRQNPVAAELAAGGLFESLQAGAMSEFHSVFDPLMRGNVGGAVANFFNPFSRTFEFMRGATEEQRFATEDMGLFDVDQVKAEESRRRLTSATGVQRGGG